MSHASEGSPAARTQARWDQARPPSDCPVTQPGPKSTPPPPIDPSLQPVPWANRWFGNPWLWTRLPQAGVLPVYRDQAGLGNKFPWWRLQPGSLSVTAGLKEGQGSFTADFPSSGYGSAGFIPSRLTFSAEGCWEVKASNETGEPLVFVIWVQEFPQN